MYQDSPLRCIFIGVKPRSRGSNLLHLLSKHFPNYLPVAFVDASVEFAKEQVQIETTEKQGGWKTLPALGQGEWERMACFGSLEEALGKVQADAAIINSPAKFHGEQIRACLEAGLHVFVAKPMTYDLNEAENLVQLAEEKKLCLVVDQQSQFTLTERTMAEWLRSQKYGRVDFVDFSIHRYRPEMRAFTGDDPFIWEQGVHSFNSLIAMLGVPAVTVSARQGKPKWSVYNGPTTSMGTIEFEGGILCNFLGTFESRAFTIETRVECERASVRLVAQNTFVKHLEVAEPGGLFVPVGIADSDENKPAERFNFEAFLTGCRNGGRVANDGRDNLKTLAVIDAFIRAAKSGKRESVRQF